MNVEMYTRKGCGYCDQAKNYLTMKNINFRVYEIGVDVTRDMVIETFPGVKTLPIISIDGKYIGGYQELLEVL
jgi:glutaredoxin 3